MTKSVSLKRLCPAFLLLAVGLSSHAAEQALSCPSAIEQKSITIAHTPDGWTASVPRALLLFGAGFLSVDPAIAIEQKPWEIVHTKTKSVETWNFQRGEDKWLACTYGNGAAMLFQKLSSSFTVCKAVYKKDKNRDSKLASVSCSE